MKVFITSTFHLAQTKLNYTKCIKVFYPPVVEFFTPVEVRLFFGGVFVCQLSSGLWVKVPVSSSSSSSSRELRMLGWVQSRESGTRSACRPQRETPESSCSAFKIKAHRCCFDGFFFLSWTTDIGWVYVPTVLTHFSYSQSLLFDLDKIQFLLDWNLKTTELLDQCTLFTCFFNVTTSLKVSKNGSAAFFKMTLLLSVKWLRSRTI